MPAVWERLLPPEVPEGRLAARVGLVSDTHVRAWTEDLPDVLDEVLRGVDLICHLGDVGELRVLDWLSRIAPVVAVQGNDETIEGCRVLPLRQLITVAGCRILLTHGHLLNYVDDVSTRRSEYWAPLLDRLVEQGRDVGARIVAFGHTHIPMVYHDDDGICVVNPGAIAAFRGSASQIHRTVALLFIRDDGAPFIVHVDLAALSEPFVPRIAWDAAFHAARAQFLRSMLAPDLAASYDALLLRVGDLTPEQVDQLRAVWDRTAQRCLDIGKLMTCADLLEAARQDESLAAPVRAMYEDVLR